MGKNRAKKFFEPKTIKQNVIMIVAIVVVTCFAALIIELGFSIKTIFRDSNTPEINKLDFSQAKLVNAVPEHDGIKITGKDAQIEFDIKRQYVDRLAIEFAETNSFKFYANVTLNIYNDFDKEVEKLVDFSYTSQTNRGTRNIRADVSHITIVIPDEVNAHVGSITLKNNFQFDFFRFGFFATVIFLILMLIIYRKLLTAKIELAFLLISMVAGTMMIVAVPSTGASWDEETHFSNAYTMAVPNAETVTLSKWELSNVQFIYSKSFDDRKDAIHHVNAYDTDEHIVEGFEMGSAKTIIKPGYVTQALMIMIGNAVGAPLYIILLMGRFGNLVLYCIVSAFAIRYIKKGKMLMFVIAMIPTSLFLATAYSYDPTVTSFMLLAFAIICNEFLESEKPISIKALVGFIVCTVIASCPKAIYIPFILIFLFLPATKFKSRRTMFMMKGSIVLFFLLMMSTFILPVLLTDNIVGDTRGGDTNTSEQFESIFSHIFSYAKLLLTTIYNTFFSFLFDGGSTTFWSFLGGSATRTIIAALLIAVSVTDTSTYSKLEDRELLCTTRMRVGTVVTTFMIMALIWTALYLSFTPVGLTQINGVQNRYYLPLFAPMLFLLNSNKIKNNLNPFKYRIAIMFCSSYILLKTVYDLMIKPTALG